MNEPTNPFALPQDGIQVAGWRDDVAKAALDAMKSRKRPPSPAEKEAGVNIEFPGKESDTLENVEEGKAPEPEATPEQAEGYVEAPPVSDEKYAVNINLQRLDDPDGMNAVLEETARQIPLQIDEARRGVQTQEATRQLSEEMGMTVDELLSRRSGEAWNAEQIFAARQILVASRNEVAKQARRIKEVGGNAEELLAFRQAISRHQAIQLQVSGMAAEAGRALSQFRMLADEGDLRVAEISQRMESAGGQSVITEMASAIDDIASQPGMTPAQINKAINNVSKATTSDMIIEYWINGLLSSPSTQAVNIASNAAVALWTTFERGIAGLHSGPIDSMEAISNLYGIVEGWKDALRLAGHAVKTGEPTDAVGKMESRKFKSITAENVRSLINDGAPGLNGGTSMDGPITRPSRYLDMTINGLGEAIRVPGRFLMAADEFFKAINYRMELRAQAYRKGLSDGAGNALVNDTIAYKSAISELDAKGEPYNMADVLAEMQANNAAVGKTITDLIDGGIPEVHMAADYTAHYNTFTKELGDTGKKFQSAINSHPMAKIVFPFIRTPVNIMKFVGERTPLAPFSKAVRAEIRAGGARKQMALARIEAGSLTAAAMATMVVSNSDCENEDFCITGGMPSDFKEYATWSRLGIQPYSLKINGSWHAYNRLDPLGWLLGATVDAARIIELSGGESAEAKEIAAAITLGISNNLINKTYLSGISDLMEIFTSRSSQTGERYLSNLAGSFVVPFSSLNRFAAGKEDPFIREADTFIEEIKLRVYGTDKSNIPVKRDFWGQPRERSTGIIMRTKGKQKDSPVDQEFMRLGWHPSYPKRQIKGIELSTREYWEYMRMWGEPVNGKTLKGVLKEIMESNGYKNKAHDNGELPGSRQQILQSVVNRWRKLTDARYMKEHPEFQDKLRDEVESMKEILGR